MSLEMCHACKFSNEDKDTIYRGYHIEIFRVIFPNFTDETDCIE